MKIFKYLLVAQLMTATLGQYTYASDELISTASVPVRTVDAARIYFADWMFWGTGALETATKVSANFARSGVLLTKGIAGHSVDSYADFLLQFIESTKCFADHKIVSINQLASRIKGKQPVVVQVVSVDQVVSVEKPIEDILTNSEDSLMLLVEVRLQQQRAFSEDLHKVAQGVVDERS